MRVGAIVLGSAWIALALGCGETGDSDFRGDHEKPPETAEGGEVEDTGGEAEEGDDGGGSDEGGESAGDTGAGDEGGGGEGCTLTQGYWKNHNADDKNNDQPWPISEDTLLCDQTWLDILWTPTNGDAWYILAHQYIAASLNVASGASTTPEVATALELAGSMLAPCSVPADQRDEAIELSELLDDYNNGNVGPGHCDDDDDGGEEDDGGDDNCDEDEGGGEEDDGGDDGDDADGDDGGAEEGGVEGGEDDGTGPIG